ncbi:MAG: chromate transporter [Candidatus Omnitrophota bacterium]
MVLMKLFMVFTKISIFAIGGAYSFLPLLEREVVENYNWLTREEFLEVLGVVNIIPGAISVKYATYVGYKISGISGVIAANLGNFLAPTILIVVAWSLYAKYKDLPWLKSALGAIQLAVFAMIIGVAFKLVNISQIAQLKNIIIVVVSFALFTYTKVHPAVVIIGVGIVGAFFK